MDEPPHIGQVDAAVIKFVRDPCASERKIGVMTGNRRIVPTTIWLGLFQLVLFGRVVRGCR
jgi:hypothetical protein